MAIVAGITITGSITSFANSKTAALDENSITVANNTRTRDTINITGLSSGDTIKIYNSAAGTKVIGSGRVSGSTDEITISVLQLGMNGGSIYVSVTGYQEEESDRVKVDFEAEGISEDPLPENISVVNNSGTSDIIYVTGVSAGDVIKVYNSAKGGKLIGTAAMLNNKTEAAVKIGQIGASGGSVFVSVTAVGLRESNRMEIQFTAEPKSDDPFKDFIIITNNAGIADIVHVTGLSGGDIVKVYNAEKAGKLMGSVVVGNNKDEATVSVTQLGTESGSAYISVTNKGKAESNRIKVDFSKEEKTEAINPDYVTVTNNCMGALDKVDVIGISGNDTVRVYSLAAGGKRLGSETAVAGSYKLTVNIPQIGLTAGNVYITVTSKGMIESNRVPVAYPAEPKSIAPGVNNITVSNNAGTPDTVTVSCISSGDTVRVYNAAKAGKMLGSAAVQSNQSEVTVNVPQIGAAAGNIYVSVTSKDENESDRTAVAYPAEATSDKISPSSVTITNNPSGKPDTILVVELSAGDTIKAYNAAKDGRQIGSAVVVGGKTEATISIPQLGTASGKVYVSLAAINKLEGGRTEIAYMAEATSDSPSAKSIFITNNAGSPDTISITGLAANDIVNVYDSANGGTVIASVTVAAGKTSVTMTVPQLGEAAGSIYVSVTSKGRNASKRAKADYSAEAATKDPDGDNVIIANNAGVADTVEVTGLSPKDVVNVYDAANGGKLMGTATVAEYKTSAVVTVTQLGAAEGTAYIAVTSDNKLQSNIIAVAYAAEAQTNAPAKENISVANNPAGTNDTVEVIGLTAGDVVNVYDAARGGSILGTATVKSGRTFVSVNVTQLGISGGKAYITVTSPKKQESSRIEADYDAEPKTNAPDSSGIIVVNNPTGTNDTVYIPGISTGDIVNLYDSATSDKLLGTQTASGSDSGITVAIAQLGRYAGKVYVTLTGRNKLESDRVEVGYAQEAKTNKVIADNVSIVNNAGTADTVSIKVVGAGDIIKVYDAATGGSILGQATVANGTTNATVSNLQLGSQAGHVYITVTSKNKLESDRTEVAFDAEAQTAALSESRIFVTNNAGADDTVKVGGLSAQDVVKVYDAAAGGTLLGSGTVSQYKSEAYVSISQLGTDKGSIYVSLTGSRNQLESDRTRVDFSAEPVTGAPSASNITVINNAGMEDTVKLIGLSSSDIINVYSAAQGGNLLATATAASGKTEASAVLEQLGTGQGKIYVSLTGKNKLESDRTEVGYPAESKSVEPDKNNISVINYAGIAASITLSGLMGSDVVNVYDTENKTNLIGTGTVQQYYTEVTFNISQLGSTPGFVYVTVTSRGRLESDITRAAYGSKPQSAAPEAQYITVSNNAGIADTITVTNLRQDDIVKVYGDLTTNDVLGTAAVNNNESEITLGITQIGTNAGKVYITVTNKGKLESARTEKGFTAEKSSTAPLSGNITVNVSAGMSGTVKVTGLVADDIVRVYDAPEAGNLLGTGTMTSGGSQVVVSIPSPGSNGGYVHVSVKSAGRTESVRTAAGYAALSTAPLESNVSIVNNVEFNDTITVTSLNANDLIKVYDSAQGGTLLGKAIYNGTQAVVSVSQLTESAGSVYITVTSFGKSESARTEVGYPAEQSSTAPYIGNITVVNNAVISDTITVTGLVPNDVIIAYDMSSGGTMLGYAITPSGSTQATIRNIDLGSTGGTVYISVISLGRYESGRTGVQYIAEKDSIAPLEGNISIVNDSASGVVTVTGLTGNDVVKVYNSAEGGNLLGVATVPATDTRASITVDMQVKDGSLYISVTSVGRYESGRTKADYVAR